MDVNCEVVYYHHSGFSVAVKDTICIFDYWEGEEGTIEGTKKLSNERLKPYEHVFFFTTHSHPDHMDPVIYTFEAENPITYITSYDMPVGARGRRMAPGDTMPLTEGVRAKAFDSTDLGVSFLVDMYGVKVFHAGDLNLWHWRQESSLREIEAAEKAFEEAMKPIRLEKIDVAMFPVDPRQGIMFDAGANQFILSIKPKVFIPMHWQGRAEIATEFARRAGNKQTSVIALTKPRERIAIHFKEEAISIEVYTTKEATAKREKIVTYGDDVAPYDIENPFAESDLPIELDDKTDRSERDESISID